MENVIFALDIIGTIAFAISGAMTAIEKKMDILGIMILGMVTAVGGGMIRDFIIGIHPPKAFQNPTYAMLALITAFLTYLVVWFKRKHYTKMKVSEEGFQTILMLADAVGLGIFTVTGVQASYENGMSMNIFIPVFLGTITGVGGGLLRDMMTGDRPYIFIKHFYACASIGGALVAVWVWEPLGAQMGMLLGASVVVILRLLAMHYKWNLPKAPEIKESSSK